MKKIKPDPPTRHNILYNPSEMDFRSERKKQNKEFRRKTCRLFKQP